VSISLPHTPDGRIARDEHLLLNPDECNPNYNKESSPHNFLLPWGRKSPDIEWIEAMTNLSNMIQWIEPLLVAVFGSSDADAVCDNGIYTEGSYRAMSTGWGIPGTTDVRQFKSKGYDRYVTDGFDWMFPDDEDAVPSGYRDNLSKCTEDGMGADIRTKYDKKKLHETMEGDAIPPMSVGYGIELRFFDHFQPKSLPQVYRLIVLIAEAGRHFTAPHYINGNSGWRDAIQSVMREGWNANLNESYVHDLMTALNIPRTAVEIENYQVFYVYNQLYEYLWHKHIHGMWTSLLLEDIPESLPPLHNPNRESWEVGAINMGYTPERLAKELFSLGVSELDNAEHEIMAASIGMTDPNCTKDLDDFIYLAQRFGMAKDIQLNRKGNVHSFTLTPREEWDISYSSPPICMRAADTTSDDASVLLDNDGEL